MYKDSQSSLSRLIRRRGGGEAERESPALKRTSSTSCWREEEKKEENGVDNSGSRINVARRILLSTKPKMFEEVLSELRILTDVPDDCVADIRACICQEEEPIATEDGLGKSFYRILVSIHDFFHARTGPEGCRLVGYMRVAYALIFLYSRCIMAFDVSFLFDPHTGVMPYRVTREMTEDLDMYNVFELAPHSSAVLYTVFYMGLVHGILLLLGIAPRLQAFGIFFSLYNFHNHNDVIFDHQEHMLRLYCFMLTLLPLDHITIYDGFGLRKQKAEEFINGNVSSKTISWPMWPFRIWQILICLVYMGAGLAKLDSSVWYDGTALYWVGYDAGFGRWFNPDWLFNRMISIKFLTWSTLALECTCFITIWPRSTRKVTFWSIVLLHLGIELTMLMHVFQYITILGWVVFLVEPSTTEEKILSKERNSAKRAQNTTSSSGTTTLATLRRVLDSLLVSVLIYAFIIHSLPIGLLMDLSPEPVQPFVARYLHRLVMRERNRSYDWVKLAGLYAGEWTLYGGTPEHSNHRFTAVIRFHNGTSPVVWQSPEWGNQTYVERETSIWADAFYYYLSPDQNDYEYSLPFHVTLTEYLLRMYSNGAVQYDVEHPNRHIIHPNNNVSSISVMFHVESGRPPPNNLDWFEPARQGTVKESDCLYVLQLPDNSNGKVNYRDSRYEYSSEEGDYQFDPSHCDNFNSADVAYHRVGSYHVSQTASGYEEASEDWEEGEEEI